MCIVCFWGWCLEDWFFWCYVCFECGFCLFFLREYVVEVGGVCLWGGGVVGFRGCKWGRFGNFGRDVFCLIFLSLVCIGRGCEDGVFFRCVLWESVIFFVEMLICVVWSVFVVGVWFLFICILLSGFYFWFLELVCCCVVEGMMWVFEWSRFIFWYC